MRVIHAVISKGLDDFGCWLDELNGIYGAGDTPDLALPILMNQLAFT